MTDNNQAYVRKCGECNEVVERLFITKVSFNEGKRRFKPLCAKCMQRYVR